MAPGTYERRILSVTLDTAAATGECERYLCDDGTVWKRVQTPSQDTGDRTAYRYGDRIVERP